MPLDPIARDGHDRPMTSSEAPFWRKCSACKKAIGFSHLYYVCSVSTCNGQRTGYVFCSVACWETHVPGARHRDAAAIEKTSPTEAEAARAQAAGESGGAPAEARAPQRVLATSTPIKSASVGAAPPLPREVLIVASRLKEYIDARSGGFNTSQSVMDVLSNHVRVVCDRAIDNARAEGRKTVMDRDFDFLKRG